MSAPPPNVGKPTPQTASTLEWVADKIGDHLKSFQSPDEYFHGFLRDLRNLGVDHLQKNRNSFKDLQETALTGVLVAPLLALYDLSADTNSNGHPDIYLKARWPGVSWKAEAKITTSVDWYCEGLVKLVDRYNSGTENDTIMIGYCKTADMHLVKAEYMEHIEKNAIANFSQWHQGPKHPEAISGHRASGNPIRVHHVWANCFYETDVALFQRKGMKVPKAAKSKAAPPSTKASVTKAPSVATVPAPAKAPPIVKAPPASKAAAGKRKP